MIVRGSTCCLHGNGQLLTVLEYDVAKGLDDGLDLEDYRIDRPVNANSVSLRSKHEDP